VLSDGAVWCWGENLFGQIGDGSAVDRTKPSKAKTTLAMMEVCGGDYHSCARTASGQVWCWGENGLGQLNDGTTNNQSTPVKSMMSGMVYQMSAGQDALLLDTLNGVDAWAKSESTTLPITGNVLSLSADKWGGNGCAVVESTDSMDGTGKVECWNQDMVANSVTGSMPAFFISTSSSHTCIINSDQTVSCWGSNSHGELGNNSTTDSSSAVLVNNLSMVSNLVVGLNHTCAAVGTAKTIECWGDNANGQLGGGASSYSSVPVIVTLP